MTKDQAATAAQERVPTAAQEERITQATADAERAIRQVAQAALEAGNTLEMAVRGTPLDKGQREDIRAILDALDEWDRASKAIQRALRGE